MKEIDPNIFYLLSFFSAAIGLLLVGIFIMYLRMVKRYVSLKDESTKLKTEYGEKSNQDIVEAGEESRKILADAQLKAQQMINTSQIFNDEQKAKIADMLSRVANEEVREYKKIIDETGKVSINTVQRLSEEVKNQITPELGKIKGTIEAEIKSASDETKTAISSAYAIVEKEVDEYKKKMYGEIDKLTFSAVKELSQKVLGKAISSKDQEDLVISALEEAKKQRIF
jgi:hypothetical protein